MKNKNITTIKIIGGRMFYVVNGFVCNMKIIYEIISSLTSFILKPFKRCIDRVGSLSLAFIVLALLFMFGALYYLFSSRQ